MGSQAVIVKGKRDGISIMLDASVDFDVIKDSLRTKVSIAKRFFEGASTTVSFKGRSLSETEEQNLLDIILEETTLELNFVESEGFTIPTTPRVITKSMPHMYHTESDTAYFWGGLRSGQSIRYNGSVVIMGDVNPGSEIIAHGNVIVMGVLKGMAHAGALGDDTCIVSALIMQPTQLRIANIITSVDEKIEVKSRKRIYQPAYAYVRDGQVYITSL